MLNRIKHREVLFNILRDFYRSNQGANLGFKGGTMLYFFHELDRFSVDLDFDLLPGSSSKNVSDRLSALLPQYGEIEDMYEKHYTLFFLLRYESGQQGVKIDISKREQPWNRYETHNFYGVDIPTLTLSDAFSHKLVAATERRGVANRDLYDIYFFLKKGTECNEDIIRDRTGLSQKQQLEKVSEIVQGVKSNTILEGIGELVDEKKKTWLKTEFKGELLSHLAFRMDEM